MLVTTESFLYLQRFQVLLYLFFIKQCSNLRIIIDSVRNAVCWNKDGYLATYIISEL